MDIVNIETKTFETMLSTFESFVDRMENLRRLHGDKGLSEWIDNQDVCHLLQISPRTLQTLRDNGTLAFSRISHKIYYNPADVEAIIPLVEDKRKRVADKRKQI